MATTFETTLSALGIKRSTTGPTVQTSAKTTLDQSDFLKLMTAQMNHQDPFNPVDNTQMVAQMAQFSSLAGISEMSTTLKAISDKLGATTASDAMNYIGKTVLTEGSVAYGRSGGGIAGAVELDGDATKLSITISDANGQVLKTMSLGKQPAGTAEFDWDGKTASGEDAGSGPFTVTATAQKDGKGVNSRTLVWAPVQSVSMPSDGSTRLTVAGLGQVSLSAVRQIG